MKSLSMLSVVALVMSGWITSHGQAPEPEVPGDHFSLEGALELFKKSESPEHFEKLLNSPDSKVNNLDLNGDGYIDYIRVFDKYERNVHVFILQAVVSESENQDIAVIELEKKSNGEAVLQIVGDEDIYGITTIIEPTREVRTYAGTNVAPAVVNVWSWPVVQYVYGPRYVVWHSPWGWHHYAHWWRPWRPVVYVHYYNHWRPYWSYYRPCHTRRVVYAHHIYHPHRTTSVVVHNRHHAKVTRYRTAHRNDSNGRTRYEDERRRSSRGADHGRRDDADRNRSSSRERQVLETRERSSSRERNVSELQRNSTDLSRRRDAIDNGPERPDADRDLRNQLERSSANRNRTIEMPQREQRDQIERRTPVQRTSEVQQRTSFENRRTAIENTSRNVRQPERTPQVQQRTPSIQRSSPSAERRSTPSVQRSSPSVQRSSPSVQRSSPSRNPDAGRSSSGKASRSRGRD